ncbi:histidinol-phosphate transaminase [Chloroflexota bacterium]
MQADSDPERLIRADLRKTTPYAYVSSLEVLSEDAGIPAEDVIKLDGNENPYGCSPRVKEALSSYSYYHIYPDSEQRELRKALEEYVGMPASRILAGSGSDELIDLVLRLFIEPGDRVVNCTPTFGIYSFSTETNSGKIVDVPRDETFSVDIHAIKETITDEGAKLVFIASPNNPSGNTTAEQDIIDLLATRAVVVLDEAYFEFSGETMLHLANEYNNLIIIRTFSKWAGLAGLRVGYGIFPENIARHLMRVKPPYNVNAAAQIAALESLKDLDYLQQTVQAIIAERQRMFTRLSEIEYLTPYVSKANFILCHVSGKSADDIHRGLERKGISVRYFNTPRLREYLRFSVGKPEHTDALIAALKEFC